MISFLLIMLRQISKIKKGFRTVDGAGVSLVRVIGNADTKDYDPFLMLDAFDSTNPRDYLAGFPMHPHRGMETITYLIEGEIEHQDSLGNKGVIHGGEAQWMTAGSGIIHQEMPAAAPRMLGAQIWLNLPKVNKMVDPAYGDIKKNDMPVVQIPGGELKIIAGKFGNVTGAFKPKYFQANYFDIKLNPNAEFELDTDPNYNLFAYLFEGSADFSGDHKGSPVAEKQAVLFTKGDKLSIKAGNNGVRMIVLSAPSLHEPVAWGGPIVMNTMDELYATYEELDNDTFLKHKKN